jgi:hypothetical protein
MKRRAMVAIKTKKEMFWGAEVQRWRRRFFLPHQQTGGGLHRLTPSCTVEIIPQPAEAAAKVLRELG